MPDATTPTIPVNVVWPRLFLLILAAWLFGCADREPLPNYRLEKATPASGLGASCASPNTGCACDAPGTLADCGEMRDRSDDYVTCLQGVRLCGDDGTWGSCAGDLVRKTATASSERAVQALGTVESCTAVNPCDPLCRQIVDTGTNISNLPDGLCATSSGIVPCQRCGYSGPVSNLAYATMPDAWQRIPLSCSPADDRCPFDLTCVGNSCQTRMAPCASANPTCAVDVTLGTPCFDPADPTNTYHVPLCNRGSADITSGTIHIGVDSRSENVATCAPVAPALGPAFPDSGSITFALPIGQTIAAGACVDVNSTNSSVSADIDLSASRAFVANFDASFDECNSCNNGNVAVVNDASGTSSTCTTCSGLECSQGHGSTLRGVVYDPAGRRPVPNAVVYVPNGTVAPFVDGVNCDSCDAMVSGSPVAWTHTDSSGHFSLYNVPSDISFPLVVQLGRWRRQFTVAPVPSAATRWIVRYSFSVDQLVLSPDATEPAPYFDVSRRLRLPATQRRCIASTCGGEGDIPKMAVLMGDADPVQCALRRIGIADTEFSSQSGTGRVQLFEANGMRVPNGTRAFGADGILASNSAAGVPDLFGYSMLVAPCNGEHQRIGTADYATSPYGSGPSYNSWPDPTASDVERANVKSFVDAGGRLMATHWLSVDFVHLNYQPPSRASFPVTGAAESLASPYDDSQDASFTAALSAYRSVAPNFAWNHHPAIAYNPSALTLYLFGNDLNAASNTTDVGASSTAGLFPKLAYNVDLRTTEGFDFRDWATNVGAFSPARTDQILWQDWSPLVYQARQERGVVSFLLADSRDAKRYDVTGNPPPVLATPDSQQACLQGDGSAFDCAAGRTWGEDHVGMFQFDAPVGAARQCGRAAVIAGHASHHACHTPSGTRAQKYCGNAPPYSDTNPPPDCDCLSFPGDAALGCGSTTALTPEELSFEYLLFSASQCIGELKRPPPPALLGTTVYVRDFEAQCKQGEQPVWQLFSWQAAVPTGARIEFHGATADTVAQLAEAQAVTLGVADRSTTTWTAGSHTVDALLRTELTPPDVSRRWLRVKMVFVPSATEAPTLSTWRAVFNCIANE